MHLICCIVAKYKFRRGGTWRWEGRVFDLQPGLRVFGEIVGMGGGGGRGGDWGGEWRWCDWGKYPNEKKK